MKRSKEDIIKELEEEHILEVSKCRQEAKEARERYEELSERLMKENHIERHKILQEYEAIRELKRDNEKRYEGMVTDLRRRSLQVEEERERLDRERIDLEKYKGYLRERVSEEFERWKRSERHRLLEFEDSLRKKQVELSISEEKLSKAQEAHKEELALASEQSKESIQLLRELGQWKWEAAIAMEEIKRLKCYINDVETRSIHDKSHSMNLTARIQSLKEQVVEIKDELVDSRARERELKNDIESYKEQIRAMDMLREQDIEMQREGWIRMRATQPSISKDTMKTPLKTSRDDQHDKLIDDVFRSSYRPISTQQAQTQPYMPSTQLAQSVQSVQPSELKQTSKHAPVSNVFVQPDGHPSTVATTLPKSISTPIVSSPPQENNTPKPSPSDTRTIVTKEESTVIKDSIVKKTSPPHSHPLSSESHQEDHESPHSEALDFSQEAVSIDFDAQDNHQTETSAKQLQQGVRPNSSSGLVHIDRSIIDSKKIDHVAVYSDEIDASGEIEKDTGIEIPSGSGAVLSSGFIGDNPDTMGQKKDKKTDIRTIPSKSLERLSVSPSIASSFNFSEDIVQTDNSFDF
ncbi:hypothetical protein ADUPG1_014223 [Aduncisulcus paluster]|uniref:Uncharacterized protein n=1 Tax=Aduncisulcus paluster TaxID=2918883 RepID=A0ABQ5KD33_9EUKA|nr:hypothetical protein ADUPG1_014223 [Aduncisulcus paluster]